MPSPDEVPARPTDAELLAALAAAAERHPPDPTRESALLEFVGEDEDDELAHLICGHLDDDVERVLRAWEGSRPHLSDYGDRPSLRSVGLWLRRCWRRLDAVLAEHGVGANPDYWPAVRGDARLWVQEFLARRVAQAAEAAAERSPKRSRERRQRAGKRERRCV